MKKIMEKMVNNMETVEEKKQLAKLKVLQNKLRSKKLMDLFIMYGGFDGIYYSMIDLDEDFGEKYTEKNLVWLQEEYSDIFNIIDENRKRVKRVYDRQTHNRFLVPDLEYDDDTMSEYIEEQF